MKQLKLIKPLFMFIKVRKSFLNPNQFKVSPNNKKEFLKITDKVWDNFTKYLYARHHRFFFKSNELTLMKVYKKFG